MPLNYLEYLFDNGIESIPHYSQILKSLPYVLLAIAVKLWFRGPKNTWERDLHGRVIMITGGTSGIGAAIAREVASKGAQLVLLVKDVSDGWLIEYIEDLRASSGNELIYAEACDLSSLHSVRIFATKWLDNVSPRRLDMLVCCAAIFSPPTRPEKITLDGFEQHWGVNYIGHYQLLRLLSPALKSQPAHRDVRVVMATCASYAAAELDLEDTNYEKRKYPEMAPWKAYGASKLALMMICKHLQEKFDKFERPDKGLNNVRCFLVNPGQVRTPLTRRFTSLGTIWGLLIYLLLYPLWFLVWKDSDRGMQTFLHVMYSPDCGEGKGNRYFRDCSEAKVARKEVLDDELIRKLVTLSEKQISAAEKKAAQARANEKTTESTPKPSNSKVGSNRKKAT